MDTISVFIVFFGLFFIIISIEKDSRLFLKTLGFFLLGLGLGLFTMIIVKTYPRNIPIEENYYLQNWGVFIAVITAIGAISISIWQGFETRNANRKTVFPKILISRDGLLSTNPGFYICNSGIGPAIIENISISFKDQSFEGKNNIERFLKYFHLIKSFGITISNGMIVSNGSVIQIGEKIKIFELKIDGLPEDSVSKCRDLFTNTRWEIHYTDIYGKKFSGLFDFTGTIDEP